MTTLILDAEKIVGDYLRTHPDVVTLDTRLVSKTPPRTDTSWVAVSQLDASNDPQSVPEHLINYLLQVDCYAGKEGGKPEASLLARTVRAALHEMPNHTISGAVVSCVRFTNMARVPDTDFEPARERFALTAEVYLHA